MRKWKCVEVNNTSGFTEGNIYEVGHDGIIHYDDGTRCSHEPFKINGNKAVCWWANFEEVFDEKEEVKMNKFKVGDVVEIVGNKKSGHGFNVGEIVTITEICCNRGREDEHCKAIGKSGRQWYVNYVDIRLENKSSTKTITITTSDTTTIITDGTHTTSINRYHTDKHNDMVALEEVVKKYKREMEKIERAEKMPKVGDMVKIVHKEELYPNYSDWLIENNVPFKTAVNWRANNRNFTQDEYKVVAIHPHISCKNMLALIEGHSEAFIFGIEGLEVIK